MSSSVIISKATAGAANNSAAIAAIKAMDLVGVDMFPSFLVYGQQKS
jgi:hypothetical protein